MKDKDNEQCSISCDFNEQKLWTSIQSMFILHVAFVNIWYTFILAFVNIYIVFIYSSRSFGNIVCVHSSFCKHKICSSRVCEQIICVHPRFCEQLIRVHSRICEQIICVHLSFCEQMICVRSSFCEQITAWTWQLPCDSMLHITIYLVISTLHDLHFTLVKSLLHRSRDPDLWNYENVYIKLKTIQ